MANAIVTVREADGVTNTDVVVLDVNRQPAATSKSVALSNEDKSQLDAAVTALQALESGSQDAGQLPIASSTSIVLATGHPDIRVAHNSTGLGHGMKTVAAAGTDEAIAASTPAKWVCVQSQTDNTGWIAVGAAGVDATEATGSGVLLDAGDSVTLLIDNLADVFIDATMSGDGVRFTYGT